jgi:hypothetical protein
MGSKSNTYALDLSANSMQAERKVDSINESGQLGT